MYNEPGGVVVVSSQFVSDCMFLESNSPDPAADILALTAILYKRDYQKGSKFYNWTDMPVKWGMEKFKLGYGRYNSALDRLVEYGIVRQMADKHLYRKQMKYKYVIRDDKKDNTVIAKWLRSKGSGIADDEEFDAEKELPIAREKPVHTQKVGETKSVAEKKVLKSPPMVDGKMQYRILKWTGKTVKFQDVSKEEYEGSATCIICGNNFDPTQFAITFDAVGIHPEEFKIPGKPGNACIACGAKACVESERGYLITGTQYDPGKRYREDWLAKEKEITELRDK